MDIISADSEIEMGAFDLQGLMLYDLPDNGLRDFEGVLAMLWGTDMAGLDDPSRRWMAWMDVLRSQ